MRARLERLIARYGQDVSLTPRHGGESAPAKAFLQPILKRREQPPAVFTPLGAASGQRWLYIGGGSHAVRPGDRAACGGLRLLVQEARPVYWENETLYYWAILRREKEAAE